MAASQPHDAVEGRVSRVEGEERKGRTNEGHLPPTSAPLRISNEGHLEPRTCSNNGIRNLAPYTSVSIVANSPPLAVISLSVNRENRVRDSLINLRENGKAVLNFLQPNQENARLVEETCKPIPREESEWDAFSIESLESNRLIMKDASMAIEAEVVAEHDLPEAKASLIVLRLTKLIVPGEHLPTDSVHLLCQHGLNRLMATPTAWDYNIESNV